MESDNLVIKEIISIGIIGIVTFIFSLFTVKAYQVAQFARGSTWNTGGPGSFLPWPREPGHLMIITEMNPIDAFINQLIIETGLLAIISFLLLCIFLFSLYRFTKDFLDKSKETSD